MELCKFMIGLLIRSKVNIYLFRERSKKIRRWWYKDITSRQ